ncbi:oxidoreductase [Streptomyces sp. RB6PN25]|uniref:Oxidoreductase n=1 Tax=Streptomyces humicola TaxID=2953240 RepID=A0ABT1PWG0_9ACTN|nr:oxidoreductase [Streptomyces humicola]MCQ4082009.1 oxidoreductase [Streptomyces humicola]
MGWTANDIPDLTGRRAVVTGANSGIGYCAARELARHGARVVLACRSEQRGTEAVRRLTSEVPDAQVTLRLLDLADLASVRAFAKRYGDEGGERLDLLVNNAGVMAVPYTRTADGFEMQFGINHLGHFALTGLLLPKLLATPGARVVSVSSGFHALANIDPGDLNSERKYGSWTAYGRSKTANLLFIHELARRVAAVDADLVAAVAHPGYADTNLTYASARMGDRRLFEQLARIGNRIVAQSADAGALPTLYAATAPGVRPDDFIGPRWQGWRGSPVRSWRAPWTLNDVAAERLWSASEQLTGVRYEGLAAAG